jgi:hypothetical protein
MEVSVGADGPATLVHGGVVADAEQHEIVGVGPASVAPVPHVVGVAAGEAR